MFTFPILIQITPTEFLLRWMWETERPVRKISLCLQGACYLVEKADASEWALPCVVGTMLSEEDSREVYRPSPLPAQTGLLPPSTGGFSSLESGQALGPAVADCSGTSKVGLWKPVPSTWVTWSPEQPHMKCNCCEIALPWKDPS